MFPLGHILLSLSLTYVGTKKWNHVYDLQRWKALINIRPQSQVLFGN